MPTPTEPFSFSPPDSPTTAMDNIRAGPDPAEESPRRSVRPVNFNKKSQLKIEIKNKFKRPAMQCPGGKILNLEPGALFTKHLIKIVKFLHNLNFLNLIVGVLMMYDFRRW